MSLLNTCAIIGKLLVLSLADQSCILPRIKTMSTPFLPPSSIWSSKASFSSQAIVPSPIIQLWRASGPPVLWCNTACIKPLHTELVALLKPPHLPNPLICGQEIPTPKTLSVSFCIDQDGQIHAEFPHGSHWVLLAFAQIITKWTKEISTEAIYGKLLRRSEEHWLISRLTRYMGNIKEKINCW